MRKENNLIQLLVKYRISIIFLVFIMVMFASWWAALIFGFTSDQFKISKRITDSIPTVLFFTAIFLLVFYIFTGFVKYRLNRNKEPLVNGESAVLKSYDDAMSFGSKKLKTFLACWGSFVGFIMLSVIIVILFGLERYFGAFGFFVFLGIPIWFLFTWKFFYKIID